MYNACQNTQCATATSNLAWFLQGPVTNISVCRFITQQFVKMISNIQNKEQKPHPVQLRVNYEL